MAQGVLGPISGQGGSFALRVELHMGDLNKIRARVRGTSTRITPWLAARAKSMGVVGVQMLNAGAPKGGGGEWARGNPPLSEGNRFQYVNPFYSVLYTVSPHAPAIVFGFSAHMPPEEAWLGQDDLGYTMRKSVLDNSTPDAPRDYFEPVSVALQGVNERECARMAATIIPG